MLSAKGARQRLSKHFIEFWLSEAIFLLVTIFDWGESDDILNDGSKHSQLHLASWIRVMGYCTTWLQLPKVKDQIVDPAGSDQEIFVGKSS